MTYLLRNIPVGVWARAKARAALNGHTLRWVLIDFLRRYASGA